MVGSHTHTHTQTHTEWKRCGYRCRIIGLNQDTGAAQSHAIRNSCVQPTRQTDKQVGKIQRQDFRAAMLTLPC